MTVVSIRLDDRGWRVTGEVEDAGEGEVGGWEHGRVFASFDEAMLAALEDVAGQAGETVIKLTRGAAKVASRQASRVGA